MRPIITLTTDFGLSSTYVAEMKGEILSRNREAMIVDISHAIKAQDVVHGAVVLDDVTRRFPPATIHVAVVDPGVGTTRRIVYAEIGDQRYLAPDNGLLTLLCRRTPPSRLIHVAEPRFWASEVSDTFHGRDIFAPVAAHLSLGLDPAELGPVIDTLVEAAIPEPQVESDCITGQVLVADPFGNLITNIRREQLASLGPLAELRVHYKSFNIAGVGRTYGESPRGAVIALLDSHGRLEIAVVQGSALARSGGIPGESVVVRRSRA